MPRFVNRFRIFEAIYFDGSLESGAACVRALGKTARLSAEGDKFILSIGRSRVKPLSWVIPGKPPRVMAADVFADLHVRIDEAKPVEEPAPKPTLADLRGIVSAIFEDDTIRDPDSKHPDDELTVIEITANHYLCDGSWGDVKVPKGRAILVRKAGQSDGA